LIDRVNLFRYSFMNILSRDAQISPDKNVNCPSLPWARTCVTLVLVQGTCTP
jgi:hypothetical protein